MGGGLRRLDADLPPPHRRHRQADASGDAGDSPSPDRFSRTRPVLFGGGICAACPAGNPGDCPEGKAAGAGRRDRALYQFACRQHPVFRVAGRPKAARAASPIRAGNGPQALWDRLQAVDSQAAQRIHPNNIGRVARALEVYQTTGKTISEHQELSRQQPSPYRLCMMALSFRDRQKLYDRINLRVEQMLEQGLLDEARWLRDHQVDARGLQAIGYKELDAYLAGQEELQQAVERIQQETRRYAKRQLTWFRRDERYPLLFGGGLCRPRVDAPADGAVCARAAGAFLKRKRTVRHKTTKNRRPTDYTGKEVRICLICRICFSISCARTRPW